MPLVSMRQLLDHAAEHGYGVPAFNVNNMEQIKAIMEAARETQSPVILQGSAGARKYAGEPFLRHLVAAAVEAYPELPIVMHQDHGASPEVCMGAIRSGFTSVMMDGSLKDDAKTPAEYAYNVAVTHKVVELAHAVGVSVEAELGCLGSLETLAGDKEDGHGAEGRLSREQLLTDPDEATRFVAETQCDALAIAIGTSHGAYKFKRRPTDDVLAIDRIKAIHARLPNTHLVMHGSSSVPQESAAGNPLLRRRYPRDLWRPDRGDSGGHPPRRTQGEHRYRHPPRHDRRHAPHHEKELVGVRSPQVPAGGDGRNQEGLHRAVRGVRLRRQGTGYLPDRPRSHGPALPRRCAAPSRTLNMPAARTASSPTPRARPIVSRRSQADLSSPKMCFRSLDDADVKGKRVLVLGK